MRRIDWGFIGVMVFFAVLMCLIALGIVGFVENERNSIQCGIVVDKGYIQQPIHHIAMMRIRAGRAAPAMGHSTESALRGKRTVKSFNTGSAQRKKNMQEAALASFLRDEGSERK